ncbi:MAG: hypothetical protein ACLFMM_00760 [Methanohalobium sp.]|uniref:hypothetical protein n=1 Tax=Methanohalobium sp. TaxID=2837493 RepID=UPI00397E5FCA
MSNTIVKRIEELSFGKILGVIYAFIGTSIGPSYLFGAATIVTMPILYGIMGFVSGIIIAVVYNLVAYQTSSLAPDLENRSRKQIIPSYF